MRLSEKLVKRLKKGKNLLAFSYGSDSTALFYTLLEKGISFDLAMVNYKKRPQSDEEEQEARKLAQEFGKKIFIKRALNFKSDFQNKARAFRYEFFAKICEEFAYENVLVAQHLNDRFEWFLRQFARGAGVLELLGMKELEKRAKFTLIRPFLNHSKAEILDFLEKKNILFFNDESNENEQYQRNFFRKHFATPFMQEFHRGVAKSFTYLEKDAKALFDDELAEFEGILKCAFNESLIARAVKKKGIVMSAKQRKELVKGDIVVSGKVGVVKMGQKALIFEYVKCEKIPKIHKELYRKGLIPKLLRPYLYSKHIKLDEFMAWL